MFLEKSLKVHEDEIKMYKKEMLRLNKENFPIWHSLMKLHLAGIGEGEIHYIEFTYAEIPRPLTDQ